MVYVDWNKAKAYCQWIGGRLPTEAEWEKAARGPSPREPKYPWGDGLPTCSVVNTYVNGAYCVGDTSGVSSYPAGASYYGVMDMAGNVWEWMNDRYSSDYYTSGGPPWINPQGPVSGTNRVVRGGSWVDDSDVRISDRRNYQENLTNLGFGFRCAKD